MSKSKFISEFFVKKQVEERVPEKRTIDGKEVEVINTIKKAKPVKVKILRPTRKLIEANDTFTAKQIAIYIKEGLLSMHMLAKRYQNDGGALADNEAEIVKELTDKRNELYAEYYVLNIKKGEDSSPEDAKRKEGILKELVEIQKNIDAIQNPYTEIFEQTAEYKAKSKSLIWWVLYLSHIENEKGEDEEIFKGNSFDQKMEFYDGMNENPDPFLNEVVRKINYAMSYWNSGGDIEGEAAVKEFEKKYYEDFPDYEVIEDEPTKAEPEKKEASQEPPSSSAESEKKEEKNES